MLHRDSTENHRLESWVYADETAREAATGFVIQDVGKIAYQEDNNSYWRLMTHSPATWASAPAGPPGTPGDDGNDGASGSKWYNDSSAPGGGTGIDGDYHLRTNGDVSFKSGGSWSVIMNIMGPPGADGDDGADGLGVPAGGTTNQVLAKASNADNDTEWVDPSGGSGFSWTTAPTNSDDTGTAGEVAYDEEFFYVCVDTDHWKCAALVDFFKETYTYSSDGDANGVFTGIGTLFGAQAWTNPHTAGYIVVAASNLSTGTLAAIVNHDSSDSFCDQTSGNWFSFDLGLRSLKVSKYSYRARAVSDGNNPTGWKFQGSNDNINWADLDIQTGLSLVHDQWVTVDAPQTVYYRYFRLLRHVADNNGQSYFCIGEFEMYGDLRHG